MEMIDRYLQAVKFWLPREQKDDIARELSADLGAEIADEEAVLGRRMTAAEVESVLKRRGRPFVVANQYLPQRQLIGPLLFPLWAFVLKLIGLVYVLPWIIVWITLLMLAPAFRQHIVRDMTSLWLMVTQIFAVVTILFAVHEHYFGASNVLARWEPSRLPRVREAGDRISRTGLVVEIVVNAIFIVWWADGFPIVSGAGLNSGTLWPQFHRTFFFPVIGLALLAIANAVVSLARQDWVRLRLLVRAFGNAAVAAIAGWTVLAHGEAVRAGFTRATTTHAPAGPPWAVGAFVDAGVLTWLAIVAIACAITCVHAIYRATASSTYGTMSKLRT